MWIFIYCEILPWFLYYRIINCKLFEMDLWMYHIVLTIVDSHFASTIRSLKDKAMRLQKRYNSACMYRACALVIGIFLSFGSCEEAYAAHLVPLLLSTLERRFNRCGSLYQTVAGLPSDRWWKISFGLFSFLELHMRNRNVSPLKKDLLILIIYFCSFTKIIY